MSRNFSLLGENIRHYTLLTFSWDNPYLWFVLGPLFYRLICVGLSWRGWFSLVPKFIWLYDLTRSFSFTILTYFYSTSVTPTSLFSWETTHGFTTSTKERDLPRNPYPLNSLTPWGIETVPGDPRSDVAQGIGGTCKFNCPPRRISHLSLLEIVTSLGAQKHVSRRNRLVPVSASRESRGVEGGSSRSGTTDCPLLFHPVKGHPGPV